MAAPSIVKRYRMAFAKYKWAGFSVGAIVLAGAGVVAAIQKPPVVTFTGAGFLAINQYPATFSTTGAQIRQQGMELNKDLLLAPNVVNAVASEVSVPPEELVKKVQVKPEKGEEEQILGYAIIYEDENKDRAGETVEALMKAMVEQSRLINSARLKDLVDAIDERLPAVLTDLKQAEAQLEQFERKEGAALLQALDGSLFKSITGAQQQQRQIRLELEGTQAQIRSLSERLGMTPAEAYVSQALSADPIIASLRGQLHQIETQLALLSRRLTPKHPEIVELTRQQEGYEELLEQRAREVIGGGGLANPLPAGYNIRQNSSLDPARQQLANALVALQTQQDTLAQQLETARRTEQELRREYENLPNKQLERERLAQEVESKKQLYSQIRAALLDAKTAEAETVSNLQIATPEPKVEKKVADSTSPIILLGGGGFLGFLLGGGVIFLLSVFEGKFYTMEEVRAALQERDLPLLGIIPQVFSYDLDREMPILLEPYSEYLEYYERLRSNIRLKCEKPMKMLLLTSIEADEGKTFSTYNLAIAAARAGQRTLIIEADMRSPSAARFLDVEPNPDNTLEPLHYYSQLNHCMRLVPSVENLYIIPSPGPIRHPAAVLESCELKQILAEVRIRFDLVVIDAPAISTSNDAWLLEPYAEGIILVTRPGYTRQSMFVEYVDPLIEDEDTKLIGATINCVDMDVPIPYHADEHLATVGAAATPEQLVASSARDRGNGAEVHKAAHN